MKNIIYDINSKILDNSILKQYIIKFFENRIRKNPNKIYFVILKLRSKDTNSFRSLHKGLIINHTSISNYIKYINNQLSLKSNYYNETVMDQIIFEYFEIPDNNLKHFKNKLVNLIEMNNPIMKFNDFTNSIITLKLPLNRNYDDWFNILSGQYYISEKDNILTFKYFLDGKLVFDFKDYDYNDKYFIREFNNQKYYIHKINQSIDLITKEIETNYLKKVITNKYTKPRIITFDIETIYKNNTLIPYLYSMYDGKNKYSWFTNSPKSLFNKLLQPKYYGYSVYAHNLSRFDIIFIFKYIASLKNEFKITPIIKDGNIISLTIEKGNNIKIIFKDSYLILPSGLAKLTKTFNVDTPKGLEPILLPTWNSSLEAKQYEQSSIDHYNKTIEIITNFNEWKYKVQKYCETDCISLYDVLIKFRELIFINWKLDIENYPTTPSLAFAIYRKCYLKNNLIPISEGKVFDFIRKSFTGGSTDMFKPFGKNIRCYDVNSLYPYIMKTSLFPVGIIRKFIGDITILDKNDYYWFGDCDISTKKDLYQPYLQLHVDTKNGMRTISPNGSFNMILNSPEYFNSIKDYNIKINHGYFFNSDNIFYNFVNDLYNLRLKYPKTDPMNMTCKLIMNSLYGRFAMKPIYTDQMFVNKNQLIKLIEKYEIIDLIDLKNNDFFCSFINPNNFDKDLKISIGIASAVTAYSRVYMSKFKNNNNYNLYYTDTDSI